MANGFDIPIVLMDQAERHLERLYLKTGVNCVLLIEPSGQLISHKGSANGIDLVNLAALIASDMAAVNEMARLLGENNSFKLLFHEGESHNILVSTIRSSFLLATIFNASVQVGLVRLYTRETVTRLHQLVELFETTESGIPKVVDDDFSSSLKDALEHAFNH